MPDKSSEQDVSQAIPATTTAEQQRMTVGQRRINLIWEVTQAIVALSVTITTLGVCAYQVIHGSAEMGAFLLLSNVFFLVVGTYFQRTNHTKSSGSDAHR